MHVAVANLVRQHSMYAQALSHIRDADDGVKIEYDRNKSRGRGLFFPLLLVRLTIENHPGSLLVSQLEPLDFTV